MVWKTLLDQAEISLPGNFSLFSQSTNIYKVSTMCTVTVLGTMDKYIKNEIIPTRKKLAFQGEVEGRGISTCISICQVIKVYYV